MGVAVIHAEHACAARNEQRVRMNRREVIALDVERFAADAVGFVSTTPTDRYRL